MAKATRAPSFRPPAPTPEVAPAPDRRAKALHPFERPRRSVRPETQAALLGFERAARTWEALRRAHPHVSPYLSEARSLRRAASDLIAALRGERDAGNPAISGRLAEDLDRWSLDDFAGTDVDVELANHAIGVLLESDVTAELPVPSA